MTALQIQEYLNLNRPGLLSPTTTISAGGSSLISPSNVRPTTSSQSPKTKNTGYNSYVLSNSSTRSGAPATAIGGSRIQPPPPLHTTSYNHTSSMPFSPMGENTSSVLPSTTTNTKKQANGKNKFQLTPTAGYSISTSTSPQSRGGSLMMGYPKKHLLPKATPELHVPLRGGEKYGNLQSNWPIKE